MFTSAADRPSWLLTGSEGYVGDDVNERTAIGFTSNRLSIKATFFPNSPPQPSKLCVHCPDADDDDIANPRVLCMAGDLILFSVAICTGNLPIPYPTALWQSEYFVYRAEPNRAELELLPNPIMFNYTEVGVLPRGNGDFTVAALVRLMSSFDKFDLLLFHSKARRWTSMKLSVVGPSKKFPVEAADCAHDLSRHLTAKVIIIGGEYGTIAWVDLWRGMVLCDVLSKKPILRSTQLPLPMGRIKAGKLNFGRGRDSRGIAFIDGCFKIVELDLNSTSLMHIIDPESRLPTLMVHDWTITTYSKSKMSSGSYEDWQKDGMVRASEVTIDDNTMVSLSGGLLLPSEEHGEMAATREATLQKLVVSYPSLSLDGDGVVYLLARVNFWHPKAWLISVDMTSKTLKSVVPFAGPEGPFEDIMYCTSRQ